MQWEMNPDFLILKPSTNEYNKRNFFKPNGTDRTRNFSDGINSIPGTFIRIYKWLFTFMDHRPGPKQTAIIQRNRRHDNTRGKRIDNDRFKLNLLNLQTTKNQRNEQSNIDREPGQRPRS